MIPPPLWGESGVLMAKVIIELIVPGNRVIISFDTKENAQKYVLDSNRFLITLPYPPFIITGYTIINTSQILKIFIEE